MAKDLAVTVGQSVADAIFAKADPVRDTLVFDVNQLAAAIAVGVTVALDVVVTESITDPRASAIGDVLAKQVFVKSGAVTTVELSESELATVLGVAVQIGSGTSANRTRLAS